MKLKMLLVFSVTNFFGFITIGQPLLTKEEAVKIALESNFDIVQSDQSILIEENNSSIYNSGYLPTLSGSAAVNFNIDNVNASFRDGSETELKNAESNSRSAGLSLDWTLFDGFNRKYSISRNKVNYTISQLNATATLEVVLLDLFNAYYEVARLQKSFASLKETLEISKDRLKRTEYGFDFGQSTMLDISNAKVDVNTDSINLLNSHQLLRNAYRNLNFILAREANTPFAVDTTVLFAGTLQKEELLAKLNNKNTQILLAEAGIAVNEYTTRISQSGYLPSLSLNGAYDYGLNNNNPASFRERSQTTGFSYGATLSWNLFDGGATKTAVQNARINQMIQENVLEQARQQALLNFENGWSDYHSRLLIMEAQRNNLKANRDNFERTEERFKLGQVTSLDFRTAQNNLLQAQLNLIEARYNAKLAELTLYQLVGDIQEVAF